MRSKSKLNTKSRLAAHITALVLLIIMLVYIGQTPKEQPVIPTPTSGLRENMRRRADNQRAPRQRDSSPARSASRTVEPAPARETPPAATAPAPAAPAEAAQPPEGGASEPAEAPASAAASDGEKPDTLPLGDVPAAATGETSAPDDASDTPEEADGDAPGEPQPDESGSLVVAPPASGVEAAAIPLPASAGPSLEVLGGGVYWLDSRHNFKTELAAIPEIDTLVLLAPLPGYEAEGVDHIKVEIISADVADLSTDAAARFIHLTSGEFAPVVAAVVDGARGAAFFKGAYLLANRNMGLDEALREIEPELKEAGPAAEEIVHRLRRLDPAALR